MDFEIDRFYEERKEDKSSGPLNLRTILVAVGLHLAAFVCFWIAAKIIYRAPEVVIPIDMTIVPPWAEQDPDDPEPDPNPPPEEEKKPEPPKPEPKPEPEPPKEEPKEKVEAVEQIKEKPKPKKKVFKKSEIKHPKKEKPKKKEFKRGKIIKPPKVKPPMKLPPGKGTSRDKPLSQAEIMKALAAGAKFGASNQLAENEEQRCISLISRRFYECWTDFNWSENLRPVHLLVKFGAGGRIAGYRIVQSSGDTKVDQSVLAAAKRAGYVAGLSADFLKKYPEITIEMKPKRQ
ncbi:MAG: energy transducer TonB [Kiritimatiellae bacterium]|nr:energy transducer TonB [Kiritimatiellia bacterium]